MDVVIVDFAKAFNRVNHSLSILKLDAYGVRGKINQWLYAFLKDRWQTVVGPGFFFLPELLISLTKLFADDTTDYCLSSTDHDQHQLQQDLQRLQSWKKSWGMAFHPGKGTTLLVTRKRTVAEPGYQLHGQTVQTALTAMYQP